MLRASAFAILALFVSCGALVPAFAADTRSSADTFVDGANTTTRAQNYGTQRTIRLRNSGQRLAYVRFPNPSGSIPRAELRLRVDTVNVAGSVELRRIVGNWTETGATFNTRPTIDNVAIASRSISASDVGTFVSFDITSLAQDWATNPAGNRGVAVVASPGSPAQVYFSSREAGASSAPVLRTDDAPPPSDNEVTVGRSGADYPDPVSASENAYQGDTWCQAPTGEAPCRIRISAGVFILQETLVVPPLVVVTGAGIGNTQLVARPGLEVAVNFTGFGGFSALEDLTVVNRQAGTARALGVAADTDSDGYALRRVAVHAQGGATTVAAVLIGTDIRITDCELAAQAGQRALAASRLGTPGFFGVVVTGSRLTATNGATDNIGLELPSRGPSHLELMNTRVIAEGGTNAIGVTGPAHDEGALRVSDVEIFARSDGDALGLSAGGNAGALSRARIVARGASSGIAADLFSRGNPGPQDFRVTIEDVYAEGTTTAISMRGPPGFLVRRVIATSSGTALLAGNSEDKPMTIQNSYFTAPTAVRDIGTLSGVLGMAFTSTVLSGSRVFNPARQYTCSDTYDGNGNQLNAQCQ